MASPLAPGANYRYWTPESRKEKRQKLAELVRGINRFKAVYAYQPQPTGEESPIAGVYSDGSGPSDLPLNAEDHFIIVIMVARDRDLAECEDLMDDLAAAVRQVLVDNQHNEHWYELTFDRDATSECGYTDPADSVISYRFELIRVTTFTECNQLA